MAPLLLNPWVSFPAAGGGSGQAPTAFSNLSWWYDLNSETGYSDTDNYSTATDQSGNANDGSAPSGGSTFRTGVTPNGGDAVYFSGSWSSPSPSIATTPTLSIQASTIIVAFYPDNTSTSGGNPMIISGRASTNARHYLSYNDSTEAINGTFGATDSSTISCAIDTWHVAALRADGNNKKLWLDSETPVTWTDTNTGSDDVTIGDYTGGSGGNRYGGYIASICAYTVALADADVQDVMDYFADQYGI